ncbi:hypothetical protein [Streptomyces scabiei]|uniref:hypothetical protein n=1 Tax=Streptomyces scabiei TaxID=1930 RepID=UPI000765E771|nr:hypothetical protein [Streptomyces scabiei]
MQVPFKHPLATHSAIDVLGHRRNGSPIYAIAGGSGEGEGASGSGGSEGQGQSGQAGDGTAGQGSGQDGQQSGQGSGQSGSDSGDGDGTDWKAMARKHEKRAKEHLAELEQLRAANMSDQEKAVTEAEKKGRTAAAAEYGLKLANAEFRAAVAAAGIDLGEAADLIDVSRFVGDDGEVNVPAIKSAVTKLSKLAPRGAGRSGGDMGGGGGSGDQGASLDKQIEEATKARNFTEVIRLKRQKAAQTT